jgi:hypothetical protein
MAGSPRGLTPPMALSRQLSLFKEPLIGSEDYRDKGSRFSVAQAPPLTLHIPAPSRDRYNKAEDRVKPPLLSVGRDPLPLGTNQDHTGTTSCLTILCAEPTSSRFHPSLRRPTSNRARFRAVEPARRRCRHRSETPTRIWLNGRNLGLISNDGGVPIGADWDRSRRHDQAPPCRQRPHSAVPARRGQRAAIRGIPTARCGRWHSSTVLHLLRRAAR